MLEPIDPDLDASFATIEDTRTAPKRSRSGVPCLLHGHGPNVWAVLERAAELGYDSRIGLEDTLTLPDGIQARTTHSSSALHGRSSTHENVR
jgi:uncharacterized protein (DUF849 family)